MDHVAAERIASDLRSFSPDLLHAGLAPAAGIVKPRHLTGSLMAATQTAERLAALVPSLLDQVDRQEDALLASNA